MWVLTVVLRGAMRAVVFDRASGTCVSNTLLSAGVPASCFLLTSPAAEVHTFVAAPGDGTAFLDVIAPPYDMEGDPPRRPCTYYSLHSGGGSSGGSEVDPASATPGTTYTIRPLPHDPPGFSLTTRRYLGVDFTPHLP